MQDTAIKNIEELNINTGNILTEEKKKEIFESFLTYRRRMARISAVQILYITEFRTIFYDINKEMHYNVEESIKIVKNSEDIFYFYKHVFFGEEEYGDNRKNRKIDEQYAVEIGELFYNNNKKIDSIIAKYLNIKWTLDKLDPVLRAILRCGIAEYLFSKINIDLPIITSEYTNIAAQFFSGKQIGFVNSLLDKACKNEKITN